MAEKKKFISDEEMAKKQPKKFISDADMQKIQPDEPGLLENIGTAAMEGLETAGEYFDRYTGAPVRAGIEALSKDEPVLDAITGQIGEPTENVEPMKQTFERFGLSGEPIKQPMKMSFGRTGPMMMPSSAQEADKVIDLPSPAGIAGAVTEFGADPTMLVPGKAVMTGAQLLADTAKGAKATLKAAGKATKADKAVVGLAEGLGSFAARVADDLSGVPKQDFKTYAKHTKEVNGMIAKYGSDIQSAAADVRQKYAKWINDYKNEMNSTIDSSLEAMQTGKIYDADEIVGELYDYSERLDPRIMADSAALDDIGLVINDVEALAGPEGKLSLAELNKAKRVLQDWAKGSYQQSGQFFQIGKQSANAAQKAARVARKQLNKAVPELAEANNELAKLHAIERNIAVNILKEDASPARLMSVGSGYSSPQRRRIGQLQDMTGKDFISEAEKLSAMRTFESPKLFPEWRTGKSLLGPSLAAASYSIGGLPLATVTGALSSPFALKQAIQLGKFPVELIHGAIGKGYKMTDQAIGQAHRVLSSPEGANIIEAALRGERVEPLDGGGEVPLAEEDVAGYTQDVLKDKKMSSLEKMRRVRRAREEGIATMDIDQSREMPQESPTIDTRSMAEILRRNNN